MKKRIISFLLVLCMVAAMLPFSALAAGNGTLDAPWESNGVKVYRDGSTLYVFGSGAMADYTSSKAPEWYGVSGNIQRIVIESSVTKLGKNAFNACGSVTTITLKRDLTMGATLNMESTSLPTGANVELQISGNAYMPDYDSNQPWANLKTRLSKVTVAEGVRSIGAQAFSGCTKLKSVVIPGSAEYIGKEAFANCVSLTDVKLIHDFSCNAVSGVPFTIGNDAFPSANSGFNIALEISGTGAVPSYASADAQPWANYRNYVTELIVDGDVPGIGNNAFHSCEKLSNITFYFTEHGCTASKVFGTDTFKYAANKTLNVVAVSQDYAFKTWSAATFANSKAANTVLYYNAQGMTVTATWNPISQGLEFSPKEDKDYGDLELGYEAQTPHQVAIKNSGNVPSGNLLVELSGGYPNAFALSTKTLSSLNPGASAAFSVAPVLNMPVGDYYTTVIVSNPDGVIATFRISYYVGTETSRAARFVMRLYVYALGRAAEDVSEAELNNYVNMLLSKTITGSQLASVFFTCDEFRDQSLNDAQFVDRLYTALLGRIPTDPERANWVNAISAGMGRNEVFGAFVTGAEFKAVMERDTVEVGSVNWAALDMSSKLTANAASDFATRLYKIVLGREPDKEGLKNWSVALSSGNMSAAQVAAGFFGSAEYLNQKKNNHDFAVDLYNAIMDREPDAEGLEHWIGKMSGGMGRSTVFNYFCTSPEFNALCATYGFNAGSIDPANYNMGSVTEIAKTGETVATEAVKALYLAILGREADEGGLATYKKMMTDGAASHAAIAATLASSQEFINRNLSDEDFLAATYKALLGRDITPEELANRKQALLEGVKRTAIFTEVTASTEYRNYCNSKGYPWSAVNSGSYSMGTADQQIVVSESSATVFVNRCYQQALGRTPADGEANGWIKSLMLGQKNAAQVAAGIFASEESKARLTDNTAFLKAVYWVLFNREADEAGLTSWGNALANGASRSQTFGNILSGAEYAEKAKAAGLTTGAFNAAAFDMG